DDVVDGVAHQRQQVDDARGRHAELGDDRLVAVQLAAAHGVDQLDAAAAGERLHQLCEVLVACGDGDVAALARRLQRQGADDVVGLDPGDAQHREAERLHDVAHRLDLRAQVVGHRRAVGLVLGIQVVAEGLAGGVEHEGGAVRLLLERGAQHVDHPEQRAGGLAGGVGQRRQRVEGAVQVGRAVDQDEAVRGPLGHAPILRGGAGHNRVDPPRSPAMRNLPSVAASVVVSLLLAACASSGEALPVPQTAGDPPPVPEGAVEAVRTADNGDVIHEYRVGGQLVMVKVVPMRGVTYYIVDRDGDGRLDPREEAPVTWFKLYGW